MFATMSMEFLLSFRTKEFAAILALFMFAYYLLWLTRNGKRKAGEKSRAAPEAAGAWPIIGHLHLLKGPELPHKTLGSMAGKFGPIFTIKLGLHPALVVSNWEMARECFTVNDVVFSNRPKSIAVELMTYNYAMFSLGPYGPYLLQLRKIFMLELLSNRRIELLVHIRESVVKTSIRDIYELWVNSKSGGGSGSNKVLVEMKKWFGDLTMNILVRMIAGKRYSGEEEEEVVRLKNALRKFFELVGVILVSDSLPFLRWFDLGGYEKAMKSTAKELDVVLQKWLDEHKQKRISEEVQGEQDFLDVLLSIDVEGMATIKHHPSYDADTITKSACLAALTGGIEASVVTLTWALSLLLNHPQALKKAQEELDIHVGNERQIDESDLKNLIYLQAIIKETLRLYPAGPLSVPRESIEDCTVGGYHIPKGTRLLVNIWDIHRDPRIWSDPGEFMPERFLTTHKDADVRGQHFELIPFGSGRRMCPGISLALRTIQLTLASLLHGFEIATVSNESIDMSESLGLSNLKATPLEVLLTPRLSSRLY